MYLRPVKSLERSHAVATEGPDGLRVRVRGARTHARQLRERAGELQFDAWRLHIQAEQFGVPWPSKRSTEALGITSLVMRIPAEADAVGDLRVALRRLLRGHPIDRTKAEDAELALTEAAENVVLHAYPVDAVGSIEVHADIEDHSLEIVVLDSGDGLPRPSDGLGIGLSVLAQLCDDFELRAREPHGLEVWMRFAFRP